MNLAIDAHAHLDSPVHRWDPRLKLVGLMGLIFAFSFVRDLRLVPAVLFATAVLYATSRLPVSYLGTRLRYPGYFLLIAAVLLPLFTGTTELARIGPLAVREEGVLALLLIVARFVAILTTGLVLFGTAPFLTSIRAMRALGVPSLLTDMALLAYRYLFEIGDELAVMERAMRLRGFRAHRLSRRALAVLSSLAGTLLVRSYERSERVYQAMVLRGYGNPVATTREFHARPADWGLLAAALLAAAGFAAAELYLRGFGG